MPPAPSRPSAWNLRVWLPRPAVEPVANFLWEQGALGLAEEGSPRRGSAVLTAPFPSPSRAAGAGRELRAYARSLRALGLPASPLRLAVAPVAPEDWVDRWKRHARPLRIGQRLLVLPSWVQGPAPPGRATLRVDPGMAFGTGSHATTRLCLEALDRHVAGGERVLDLGTGSGILAIAAARLGARAVLAVDRDPVACRVARENVRRNGVGGRVRVRRGGLAGLPPGRFDLAVGNLTARDLEAVLPSLLRRVRPGGLLVLSGILAAQEGAMRRLARRNGLGGAAARRRGWVALVARRPMERRGRRGAPPRVLSGGLTPRGPSATVP